MSSLISSDKIKARHFHSKKHLIDDFCVIKKEENLEGRSICAIYPKELKLKVEDQNDNATFFNFDITKKGRCLYK